MKTLIIYSYYNKDFFSKKNVDFFLKNGYIDNPNYHFLMVINGEESDIEITEKYNLKIYNRNNEGFDFGGWGYGLSKIKYYDYDNFIFLNSTCIGPFIPRYISDKITWIDLFTSKLDSEYKLCGPTINYLSTNKISDTPHIQSFAFSTDLIGLTLLINNNIFNPKKNIERKELILKHEIGLSKTITDNFYKLFAFQLSETKNNGINEKHHDDIHYVGKYYNDTINPIEVMFVKSNRINNKTLSNYVYFLS
jgi:lipopolysaccharide biosynthesis protein